MNVSLSKVPKLTKSHSNLLQVETHYPLRHAALQTVIVFKFIKSEAILKLVILCVAGK